MDRKSIIGIAFGVFIVAYLVYENVQNQAAAEKEQAIAAAQATPGPTVAEPTPVATPAPAAQPETNPEPAVAENTQQIATPLVDYTFTNLGGGIKTAKLLQYEGGKPDESVVLNAFGRHPIGALGEQAPAAATGTAEPAELPDKPYAVTVTGKQVVCERDTPQGIHIKKIFLLPGRSDVTKLTQNAADYSVHMDIEFSNRGTKPAAFGSKTEGADSAYSVYAGSALPIRAKEFPTDTALGWYRDGKDTFIDVNYFEPGKVPFIGVQTSEGHATYNQTPGGVVWAGMKNQYFSTILSANPPAQGVWGSRFPEQVEGKDVKGIQGMLLMPGFTLDPGTSRLQSFTLYAGPNEYRLLQQLGHGESSMVKVRFKWISLALLGVMNWLHLRLPFHSYAIAIVILTFIVRGALWPIQGAATKSMKRMQEVQPKMTEMREKYKDDPARMNQEMMKLYKEHKINPLAGCLPMVIQIPIFFAFYSMLGSAVELRGSHFLWIHDLSQPDTVYHLFGFPVNILPIFMAGTMIWQMSISPKSGDPAQQKMMMFMPLMFVFFCYNFASALALYYTMSNVLSIIQLYLTRNQALPAPERPAAGKSGGRKPGRYQ